MKLRFIIAIFMAVAIAMPSKAQKKDKTREEVLNMTTEEMSSLPLEELMELMDVAGVSSLEELYDLLLNKDVTSASKTKESLFESPLSSTVLSSEEIETSGATSIEEALRLVPGLIVREKSNGNFDVHIRGLDNLPPKNMMLQSENTSTLVMINGRPVFNYAMGGIIWESLPIGIGDIDRIEIVRGPSSALYGPNAVSGAINIITKKIDTNSPLISGHAQGGNMSTFIGDIGLRKQLNSKLGLSLTGNYERRDRSTDELYVFKEKASFSKEEFSELTFESGGQTYTYKDPKDNIDELFAEPGLSKEKAGVNAFVSYEINADASFDLSGGYQYSFANTSTLGDNATSIAGRESSTSYIDLKGKLYGVSLQASYMFGFQDFGVGNVGFQTDMGQFNSNVEYNLQLKSLTIRPGINYMSVFYDDSNHIPQMGAGFFNGKKELSLIAPNVRLDYMATEKLRLVAALRSEKYSHSDSWTPSWQFVSAYKINDNNHVRVVYSRANRSPFIIDMHSNFLWDREGRPSPNFIYFGGNDNMEVMTSDLLEVGYRLRPAKNILVDIEGFYSHSKNFSVLAPDSTNLVMPFGINVANMQPTPLGMPEVMAFMRYQNIPLEANQMGLSVSLDWIMSEKLVAKAHFTYQQTRLDNYNPVTRDETIGGQAGEILGDGTSGLLFDEVLRMALGGQIPLFDPGNPDPNFVPAMVSTTSSLKPTDYEDGYEHKATPSYWGSIGLDYKPTKQFSVFTNAYYYGKQTFQNQYDTSEVDAKILLNIKANYKVSPSLSLFVNARNVLNDDKKEFAFMDNIGSLYLAGLNFKW